MDVVLDCAGADGGVGYGFPLDEGDGVAGNEVDLQDRCGRLVHRLSTCLLQQKARKYSCQARQVFVGLVPLDLATLPATVHSRLWRLALHLGGRVCIAIAAESPVRG